jgi:hypothetical protein
MTWLNGGKNALILLMVWLNVGAKFAPILGIVKITNRD